jgi:starch synthase (maltosyl-transferring)
VTQRIVIRDVGPRTPLGGPAKTVVGDPVRVRARFVRDGHGRLAGRVRFRRVDGPRPERTWSVAPMVERGHGDWEGTFSVDAPGRYEFEVQAWLDHVATWRRDLERRAAAGQDLEVEFEVGARLIEARIPAVPAAARARLAEAVATLRSTACSDAVRLAAGLDDAVAATLAPVVDAVELSSSPRFPLRADRELGVRGAWYEFFPRSEGGFHPGARTWDRLEAIAAAGFDVVYLPPIHPIGRTNRKGRNNTLVAGPGDVGSPWAIGAVEGGHTALHPDLGTMADFDRFVRRAGELGLEVALDYALQCSPDHPWAVEHPEWFTRLPDGSIRHAENPPKQYQDIYPLNFWPDREEDRVALWEACRAILEFWCDHGVRVFRVDNPHTKPLAFWSWLIPSIQHDHPDLVFLSEAFTDPAMMHSLADIGFTQSYTYFTWRTTKWELESYGEELAHGPAAGYFRPNLWPNTPDILSGPLRNGPRAAFALRAVLAATLAPSWGVYSGFELCENTPASPDNEEYLDSEKYELKHRDWERPGSLLPFLATLNRIRRQHPATWRMDSLRFHPTDHDTVIAYSHHRPGRAGGDADTVLVVVNLDPVSVAETVVRVDLGAVGVADGTPFEVRDELTGETWSWRGSVNYVRLDPAERVAHVFTVVRG